MQHQMTYGEAANKVGTTSFIPSAEMIDVPIVVERIYGLEEELKVEVYVIQDVKVPL